MLAWAVDASVWMSVWIKHESIHILFHACLHAATDIADLLFCNGRENTYAFTTTRRIF